MSGDLVDKLRTVLATGPQLRLGMLFGSFARGAARADSDIDVAILPVDPQLSLRDELDLQAQLSTATGREVDLVRLDHCNDLLRWRIAREGVVLLARPAVEGPRFRARAGIAHADLQPQLAKALAVFRRRLAGSPEST